MPLLQDLLHKNMPQATNKQQTKANQSNSSNNVASPNRSNNINNNNTLKTCATATGGISVANSSSNCEQNNCSKINNNNNNNNKTNKNKNNINTNMNTSKQSKDKPTTKTKDTKETKTTALTTTSAATVTATTGKPSIGGSVSNGSVSSNCTNTNANTSTNSISTKQVNRLSVPQKEDSGTESGEDLRLLAAGLRDKLQMESDSNVIDEVTTALSRLESSLKEGKEISVDGNKRKALLALVARLQTGLTSPEKLAEIANAMAIANMDQDDGVAGVGSGEKYDETSSPEADHRSNRQRFAKRRNRNSRHTVGVSREELADARRYMEDMLMMDSISNCTTPDSNVAPVTPPQWFPVEKNASTGSMLGQHHQQQLQEDQQQHTQQQQPQQQHQQQHQQHQPSQLYRPNQFVPSNIKNSTECLNSETHLRAHTNTANRRPLSGDYSVSFGNSHIQSGVCSAQEDDRNSQNQSPDSLFKSTRFTNKKTMMKRANTIDIPKSKKYNPDFDTDSELEEKGGPGMGLKRAVQVSVKRKVHQVVPPFEPKTENDHKFLAFINKQSSKSGLGWNGNRSVSNWTNKFGSIKNTFEVGAAATVTTGKPPQVPGHVPQNAAKNYWNKQGTSIPGQQQEYLNQQQQYHNQLQRNQQQQHLQQQQLQQQQQQQQQLQQKQFQQQQYQQQQYQQQMEAAERQRRYEMEARLERDRQIRLDKERLDRDRIERDRQERQRQERDRLERDRVEREYYERERQERERLAAEQHAAMPSMTAPQPAPVNKFIHAPQSVFRPIDNIQPPSQNIYKPVPQIPQKLNSWQPPHQGSASTKPKQQSNMSLPPQSPQYLAAKPSYGSSPSPTATSPVGLPWVSKPTVDNSDFKKKAHRFEERSLRDNLPSVQNPYLQRHNSLRSAKVQPQQYEDYRKRPSLPNTTDPYLAMQSQYMPQHEYTTNDMHNTQQQPQQYQQPPPPPTNISFTYADYTPPHPPRNLTYRSYPCLPTAVDIYAPLQESRKLEDSLTNPQAEPLILTSSNPSYGPLPTDTLQPYVNLPPRHFDYVSPVDSTPTSPSFMTVPQTDNTDDDLDSDNMMEYRVESKVMRKPRSQTAVTVAGRRTAHMSDDEVFGKNSRAAKNLLHTMKHIGAPGKSDKPIRKPLPPTSPQVCLSPDGRSYQAPIVEPLFPEVTNFEPNRTPLYVQETSQKPVTSPGSINYQQNPTYAPPLLPPQSQQTTELTRSLKDETHPQRNVPQLNKQAQLYAPGKTQPYTSETQNSYVVTYPIDDSIEDQDSSYQNQPPISLPLNRSRHFSENSTTSSSMSYNNLPSPNTNWTANPVHADDITSVTLRAAKPYNNLPTENISTDITYIHTLPYQQKQQPSYIPAEPPTVTPYIPSTQTARKPDLAPKPHLPPLQVKSSKSAKPAKSTNQSVMPTLQTTPIQTMQLPPQPIQAQSQPPQPIAPAQPTIQTIQPPTSVSITTSHPKLTTRSQTISTTNQKYEQPQQQQQQYKQTHAPMLRQRTIDNGATMMSPLQSQNRVLSQQSLVMKQQQQFNQQQQQQLSEMRRKSLGNALDMQHQHRKSEYFETHQQQTNIKQAYISSAPADTPDIVKSSLPKDENAPILKKFGPPQRHHYMPNAYQSPAVGTVQQQSTQQQSAHSTATTTSNSGVGGGTQQTKITKTTTAQREIVQHSTYTTKPSIVETPATPQPTSATNNTDDQIPRNIVFNNISAFTSMSRRHDEVDHHQQQQQTRPNRLSKSDSWNQIVQQAAAAQPPIPSPKFNSSGGSGNELRRCKSGHSLAVPKMYEAGIDKKHISEKQKTVAAYFSGQKSPNNMKEEEMIATEMRLKKTTAINRTKTSEKVSASRKSLSSLTAAASTSTTANGSAAGLGYFGGSGGGGLSRSATMPHIANLNLLDESNVEDAFEQLMMGS